MIHEPACDPIVQVGITREESEPEKDARDLAWDLSPERGISPVAPRLGILGAGAADPPVELLPAGHGFIHDMSNVRPQPGQGDGSGAFGPARQPHSPQSHVTGSHGFGVSEPTALGYQSPTVRSRRCAR